MSDGDSADPKPPPLGTRDFSPVALAAGFTSFAWGVAIYLPQVLPDGPAWPAASLGIVALVLARLPGRPLLRGLASFLGVLGLLAGLLQLLALWGIVTLLE